MPHTDKEVFLFSLGGEKMKEATLNKKSAQTDEVLAKLNESTSAVFVDCIGLTVAEVSDLRTKLYNAQCEMKVIKNNILKRAAEKAGYQGLDNVFSGPSALVTSKDASNASKIVFDFAKTNDKLKVKAGVVENQVMNAKELKVFASLPNKEGMIAMLLSVLQAPIRNLGCAIKAIAEKEA